MSRRSHEHARRLVATLDNEVRQYLCEEPFVALGFFDVTLRLRPESGITGDCSVWGSYDPGPPKTITVVETSTVSKQYFTALHELGHCLSAEDDELHDAFDDERDQGKRLEEDVCDAVAAELLLPDDRVDEHIGPAGPTARGVLELFRETLASREACCVRAAQRIGGTGHVMLAKDGVARFTASRNTIYRVRRDTPQPAGHLVREAERGSARRESQVAYASGALSDLFFADAVCDDDGYVFAVFVDSNPAWASGPAIMGRDEVVTTAEAYCPHCDVDFEGWGAPCPRCGGYVHRVDTCGKCACEHGRTQGEKLCEGCFIVRPPADWQAGGKVCDICVDG